MSDVRGARAEGEGEAPAVSLGFLPCKEGCSITRDKESKTEERAEDVDYCLRLIDDDDDDCL